MTDQSAAGPTTNFNYLKTGAGKTERKALCICCSYPGTQLALPGCVRDQAAMVDMLPKQGYEVTFLTDGDNYHEKPTKANIVREMKKLCAWLSEKEGRQGWISYSGHGANVPDDEIQKCGYSEEKDGLDEAMVNIDYQSVGLLTDDELKEILVFSKGSSLMVFMDCCHSGTILDLPYRLTHKATGPDYDVIPECGTRASPRPTSRPSPRPSPRPTPRQAPSSASRPPSTSSAPTRPPREASAPAPSSARTGRASRPERCSNRCARTRKRRRCRSRSP
mmetsp:Transcript_12537/g.42171  ORF Transcript_12537/g.42171 Transcript_12537/m.42171 type:complete len:277 (+) Transcript_12537:60-890(+)